MERLYVTLPGVSPSIYNQYGFEVTAYYTLRFIVSLIVLQVAQQEYVLLLLQRDISWKSPRRTMIHSLCHSGLESLGENRRLLDKIVVDCND